MTVLAIHQSLDAAIIVADTRLSTIDQSSGTATATRDVCQKLFAETSDAVLTFSGDLCFGRDIVNWYRNRLRREPDDLDWLHDDDEVGWLAHRAVQLHSRRENHYGCVKSGATVCITWINGERFLSRQHQNVLSANPHPIPQTIRIEARGIGDTGATPRVRVIRQELRFVIAGSGGSIREDLGTDEWVMIANWGRAEGDGLRTRALFFTDIVSRLLIKRRIDSVGGLLQVATMTTQGVEVIPYLRWMEVEPGYGTYVALRFDDGSLVQEHRPTGRRIRIASPHEIPTRGPIWDPGTHERFDPASELTRVSPGVVPELSARLAYAVYDHESVPAEIVRSWGTDPLPPNTYVDTPRPTLSPTQWKRYVRSMAMRDRRHRT